MSTGDDCWSLCIFNMQNCKNLAITEDDTWKKLPTNKLIKEFQTGVL